MSKKRHIIIGSGPAALSAVNMIRSLSQDDGIKIVSREKTLPYCPAVLPYLLAGRTAEDKIWLRDEDFFQKMDVTFAGGQEVMKILPNLKQVLYRDGAVDQYDSLLIAAGAEPALSPTEGLDTADILRFHTLDDYHRLSERLAGKRDVTVLGAGLVAVELAIALVERGNRVRLIGRGRPLRAYFDEQAGGYIREILVSQGVEITTGKNIIQIKKQQNGLEVRCADGEIFATDLLVSCLGVKPRLSFVEGSGISVHQGILVDRQMRTNVADIYAAGDITESLSAYDSSPGISAILPNAIAQGKVAGSNMAGKDSDYDGWLAMNVLKMFGNSAFSIGMAMPEAGEAEVREAKDDQKKRFKRLVTTDKHLIGAMFINVDLDPGVIKYLIEKRVDISACQEALFEQPKETSSWLMLKHERGAAS